MKAHKNSRTLLLFDIDGTLILTGGRGKKAMVQAVEEEFGTPIRFEFKDFAGSTDRKIIRTLMAKNGIQPPNVESAIDRVLERYLVHLGRLLANGDGVEVLPGIRELLEIVRNDDRFALGLVTGNIEPGGRLKLETPGLNPCFPIGAFGNDNTDRNLLPPLAIRRAEAYYHTSFSPEKVWVIGDTPRDIRCGKANGLRCLAVATGGWELQRLREHQPDVALPSLENAREVLKYLVG